MTIKKSAFTYTYIDVSDATPLDRLQVTFENGQVLIFKLGESDILPRLDVDPDMSDPRALDELYQVIQGQESSRTSRNFFGNKKPTLAEIQDRAELFIWVGQDSWDQSPRPGRPLRMMVGLQDIGASSHDVASGSPVKSVESLTLR